MAELFEKGLVLFEEEKYDEAVAIFIESYKKEDCKDKVLDFLYSCFITPNEQEFKDNYNKNIEGISSLSYEALEVDFIPVAEDKYYIFDKTTKTFEGSFVMSDLPADFEENFDCLLVKDYWNIGSFADDLDIRKWNVSYIVVGDNQKKFLSFCKLPDFAEKYLYNSFLVGSLEQLELVLRENDGLYLPKRIFARNRKECVSVIDAIHASRIQNKSFKRDNILLSICIPSYNRGMYALRDVKKILESDYDAEIEVIVSDNCSENSEGYEELANISDSRFTYYKASENGGFIGNIIRLLSMAKGQFAIFSSDDDFIKLENLGQFLKALHNRREAGFLLTSGTGPNFSDSRENVHYKKGPSAHSGAINCNYLTGSTFNMNVIKNNNIIERIKANLDTTFVIHYIHCAIATLCSEYNECWYIGIDLWDANDGAEDTAESRIYEVYASPSKRIEQQNSAIEFIVNNMNISDDAKIDMILERIGKGYHLTRIAAINLGEFFYAEYNYIEAMVKLHTNNVNLITDMLGSNIVAWIGVLEEIFFRYVGRANMGECSKKEEALSEMLLQLIKYKKDKGEFIHEMNIESMKSKILEML